MRRRVRSRATGLILPGIALLILAYFAWHGLNGRNGYWAAERLETQAASLEAELEALKAERRRLERHVALLRPESLDPDMLEERAREILNLARPNDIVVMREAGRVGD